jgi:hypothetical protein
MICALLGRDFSFDFLKLWLVSPEDCLASMGGYGSCDCTVQV